MKGTITELQQIQDNIFEWLSVNVREWESSKPKNEVMKAFLLIKRAKEDLIIAEFHKENDKETKNHP